MNQTFMNNLSQSKIMCEYYYEYYYVINFHTIRIICSICEKDKMQSQTLLQNIIQFSTWKIWQRKNFSVWFLVFLGALSLVSFPPFPISTSFLSLFFPFPFFSFSHIHPRSIVCILDAHTLYPKRRYTDTRARMCVCVYARIYDYVYVRNWKYRNDFTDG